MAFPAPEVGNRVVPSTIRCARQGTAPEAPLALSLHHLDYAGHGGIYKIYPRESERHGAPER